MKRLIFKYTPFILLLAVFNGCKKQDDFLDEKPNAALSTINSLTDCQNILQNTVLFNNNDVALGQLATDEYYLTSSAYQLVTQTEQDAYIWAKVIYPAGTANQDFGYAYSRV